MAMSIGHYRQLRVYELSTDLRRAVFAHTKHWPREEQYALTDQIRRSSRSIGANIAEAWAKRLYRRHFASKLTDALAEAEETTVWLDIAFECDYLAPEDHAALAGNSRQICGGLVRMIREPDKWCGPAGRVREGDYSYDPEDPE
jgi:four helix bundle protein